MIYLLLQFFVLVSSLCSSIEKPTTRQANTHTLDSLQEQINKLQRDNAFIRTVYPIQNNTQKCQNLPAENSFHEINFPSIPFKNMSYSKQMQNHCQIALQTQGSYFLFQTPRSSYIGINNAKDDIFCIYNPDCLLIASISNITVQKIYCDRGTCEDGNVIILSQNLVIVFCSQSTNFTNCKIVISLIDQLKGQFKGMVVRNKGLGQLQLYIADSSGDIIIYDGNGNHKLSVLVEKDNTISHFIDIHPHPLIISGRGWFYTFDYVKYNINLTRCPYIFHDITHIFMSHSYSTILYLINPSTITKLNIRSVQKDCHIISRLYNGDEIEVIKEMSRNKMQITQYQGNLYVGNKIISIKQKSVREFRECGNYSYFNFQLMKNNRKGFFTLYCCDLEQQVQKCRVIVFKHKITEQNSNMSGTVIMIVILLLIVLLIFYFIHSSDRNQIYEQQLQYNKNLRYKYEVDKLLKNKSKEKDHRIIEEKFDEEDEDLYQENQKNQLMDKKLG